MSLSELIDRAVDGFLALDGSMRIVDANEADARLVGVEREALVGRELGHIIPGAAADRLEGVLAAASSSGTAAAVDVIAAGRRLAASLIPSDEGLLVHLAPDRRAPRAPTQTSTLPGNAPSERSRVEQQAGRHVAAATHVPDLHLRTLVTDAPIGMFVIDADFRIIEANRVAATSLGSVERLRRDFGETLRILWPRDLAESIERRFRHTLATGESYHDAELAGVRADRGATEYYDWRIHRLTLADGRYGVVCYFNEISTHVHAREAIAASEDRYRTLFDSIDEGFCILQVLYDEHHEAVDHRFEEVNPAFERQTGLRAAEGRTLRELVSETGAIWSATFERVARSGQATRFVEYSEGLGRWFDVFAFRIGDPREHRVAVLFTDITDRKHAEHALRASEARLHYRAHHDGLTGLPNRILFEDRLRIAVATANRHGRVLAVLYIDLDGFKLINDNLGHAAGDTVIEEIARRLQGAVRQVDTLARLHGDEFIVLLSELSHPHDADLLARALLATLGRPISVAGRIVSVSASIGVSVFPRDAGDPLELIQAADAAMYRAKLAGKNDVRHFAFGMLGQAHERSTLAEHIDGAIERGEMKIRYQPQWDTRTGSITTFEALLRWQVPGVGEVLPERFVPIAEMRGAFGPIVAWTFDTCAAFARDLSLVRGMPLRVSLQVSGARLVNSNLVNDVIAAVRRHHVDPHQFELEVSLDSSFEDATALRAVIERCRRLGVRTMLNHFGGDTGMVAAILDIPFDGVKLEAPMVRRADRDPRLRRGLASVVGLVLDLGLDVVAVGLETASQRDLMLEIGCKRLQGPLIGGAMTSSEAKEAVRGQEVLTLFVPAPTA